MEREDRHVEEEISKIERNMLEMQKNMYTQLGISFILYFLVGDVYFLQTTKR